MKKMNDYRGEIIGPIQADGWDIDTIVTTIKHIAENKSIPIDIKIDEISTGGLFGKKMPCIIISHPNPPISYFQHMIIINGNIFNFQFWGMSKANYNNNMKEMDRNSGKLSGLIKSALRSDMSMELQTEQIWHQKIISIYNDIWFPKNE
ncbi:hypothetical protein [Anaerofustis butyriciformans]|uniref:hypothetical protein n=1 Tax=Anaerofustis butyriciformans TaxID=3108533 RepID=UPI002E331986|nr:hypothetical protein [Anaerofustis sp. HA2171]